MRVRYFIMLILFILSCEEEIFDNPVDPETELSPEDWAPTNLTIEILTDSDALLSWQKSEIEATGFKVERQETTGGTFVEIGSSDTTNYTDTALIVGNEYLYQVCAYSGDNKSSYATSDTIVTTFPAPYNINALPINETEIQLTWDDSTAFENGFSIERKNIQSKLYTIIDSTAANTYKDTSIILGTQYVYQVAGYTDYNISSYTDTMLVNFWIDCANTLEGYALVDSCGTCDADTINDCTKDCNNVWGGSATLDACDVCSGGNTEHEANSDKDTCGVCFGTNQVSIGTCDCEGTPNGSATIDNCANCVGGTTGDTACIQDCAGTWGGNATTDYCGVCDADSSNDCEPVTDIDGNTYNTVVIGTQTWMKQNLRVTKYKNGDDILFISDYEAWCCSNNAGATNDACTGLCSIGKFANYTFTDYEGNTFNPEQYNFINDEIWYNGYVVQDSRGICMYGWHVPSYDDWTILINHLGGVDVAGGKMKDVGESWDSPNTGASNESGFTALPAGQINYIGGIHEQSGDMAIFWSSTNESQSNDNYIWFTQLSSSTLSIYTYTQFNESGHSVRCIEGYMDCAGVVDGTATVDNCGDCVGGTTDEAACVQDCNDEWGGSAVEDSCGVCDSDSSNDNTPLTGTCDCAGTANGTATADNCGTCDTNSSNDCTQDCAGVWGGTNFDTNSDGICDDWETVTDVDGNTYTTVLIGEQLWIQQNLKVTKYNNGEDIPNITNYVDWGNLSIGAYCDYDNNPTNSETYGRLYNWYTGVDSRGVCPDGWHVPSIAEYSVLTDYLGGTSVAGGKMKETGLEHWISPNTGATNESGFTGLPAGYRYGQYNLYSVMGNYGYFWSSSEGNPSSAWTRVLNYNSSNVVSGNYIKRGGFSIRCLKD